MFAVCYRYTQSKDLAMEMMNLGFAKVMLSLKKYDQKQPLKQWMKSIMINVIIDEFRKTNTYKKNIKIYDRAALANEINGWSYDKHNGDVMQAIELKLKDLQPITRSIFNLYAIDGYKHKEIADMLSIPEGTCHYHYSQAKKELKTFLAKEWGLSQSSEV